MKPYFLASSIVFFTCLEKKGSTYLVYDGERNNHHREVKCDTIQIACIELFKHMTLDEEKIEEMKEELIKYVALD